MKQLQRYIRRLKKAWVSRHGMLLMSGLFIVWAGFRYGISKTGIVCGLTVLFFTVFLNFWFEERKEKIPDDGEHGFLQYRLRDMAASFHKLSRMMEAGSTEPSGWSEQEKGQAFSAVTEKMCADCARREYCWEKEYYDTCQSAYTLVSAVAEQGQVDKKQVPSAFRHRCIHMDQFLKETHHTIMSIGNHRIWANRFLENRLAFAGQMDEVAGLIEDLAVELSERKKDTEQLSDQILKDQRYGPFKIKKCTISNEGPMGRCQKVYLMVKIRGRKNIPSRDLAGWVSEVTRRRFIMAGEMPEYIHNYYEMIELVEDTRYRVIPGVARYTPNEENICGDSYAIMQLDSGQAVLTLSDGMGSGEKARDDSEWLIGLLEHMVDTGFGRKSALRMMNSMMMFREDRDMFSSMDMTVIDLYSGICDFVKAGAASTFVKRGEKVECVTSGALPMGVFPEIDCENVSRNLFDGDVLVMVTDGIVNRFHQGNAAVCELLSQIDEIGPKGMATAVLNEALNQVSDMPEDDMTVLVCTVCKKSASVL